MEQEVLNWIWSNIWQIIVILSLFIEITPIKWNPLSSAFKWLGRKLTARIEDDLTAIHKEIEENEKDRIRWEILDFANSCRNGRKHTKDEYQHILTLNDKYIQLLSRTHDKNGVFEAEYEYIKKLYAERQMKNDFL